ncbi:MAG: hypothetical protein EHM48_00315 [Planctomycetaceae bacterium]|nr:MAG: hypothetical protein EHM48_00315 [Planctomycetaceae bacterium]
MLVKPVTVAWFGLPAAFEVRIPAAQPDKMIRWELELEDGGRHVHKESLGESATTGRQSIEGISYLAKKIILPAGLPAGYHRLRVEVKGAATGI